MHRTSQPALASCRETPWRSKLKRPRLRLRVIPPWLTLPSDWNRARPPTSVAVGRAKREEGSIRPGFVNGPGNHRVGEQSGTIAFQLGIPLVDLLDPVGVEQ